MNTKPRCNHSNTTFSYFVFSIQTAVCICFKTVPAQYNYYYGPWQKLLNFISITQVKIWTSLRLIASLKLSDGRQWNWFFLFAWLAGKLFSPSTIEAAYRHLPTRTSPFKSSSLVLALKDAQVEYIPVQPVDIKTEFRKSMLPFSPVSFIFPFPFSTPKFCISSSFILLLCLRWIRLIQC